MGSTETTENNERSDDMSILLLVSMPVFLNTVGLVFHMALRPWLHIFIHDSHCRATTMRWNQQKLHTILKEAVTVLCKNQLQFTTLLHVQGLLGVYTMS